MDGEKPTDTKSTTAPQSEPANAAQDPVAQADQPLVRPIVLVPGEQTAASELPDEATSLPDNQPVEQPAGPDATLPIDDLSGAEAVAQDAFEKLLQRMQSHREFQLPLSSQSEEGISPRGRNSALDELIERFKSLPRPDAPRSDTVGSRIERGLARPEDAGPRASWGWGESAADGESRRIVQLASPRPGGSQVDSGGTDDAAGDCARIPQLQVFVQLAGAKELYDECMDAAAKKLAPLFKEVAVGEVEQAAWRRQNQERAADYRLRGPHIR